MQNFVIVLRVEFVHILIYAHTVLGLVKQVFHFNDAFSKIERKTVFTVFWTNMLTLFISMRTPLQLSRIFLWTEHCNHLVFYGNYITLLDSKQTLRKRIHSITKHYIYIIHCAVNLLPCQHIPCKKHPHVHHEVKFITQSTLCATSDVGFRSLAPPARTLSSVQHAELSAHATGCNTDDASTWQAAQSNTAQLWDGSNWCGWWRWPWSCGGRVSGEVVKEWLTGLPGPHVQL